MADNTQFKPGDIIERCYGYSMVLYTFYKVIRVTDKSIMLQEYESKVHPDTTDGFRPLVEPDFSKPKGKIIRKGLKTYIGNLWDGKPCQEDHMD
ncbi:MAG: hypothetical protein K8V75_04090 [Methanobrevibacter woesei]|nr:hypothetical protein [Methanobrevibacter woesei]